jgi:uncharacterized protein (DUF2236 family)
MATQPDSIGFIHEGDLLRITGVSRSTRQNWVRAGLVDDPRDGRYRERHVVETVVVARLVRVLKRLEDVARLWRAQRKMVLGDLLVKDGLEHLVALIEPRTLRLSLVDGHQDVAASMRPWEGTILLPLGVIAKEARADFWTFAASSTPRVDRRRRSTVRGGRSFVAEDG